MTLVELLVVLLILSILTVVALQSTDLFVDQSRFDATQQTLRGIEEAIRGPLHSRQPDGTATQTGFVADMGRLPRATAVTISGTGTILTLQELWLPRPEVAPFAVRPATAENVASAADVDVEIFIPCGWRGPYLRLPSGTDRLRDGWGLELANPLGVVPGYTIPTLFRPDDAPVAADGELVLNVQSPGANGTIDVLPTTGYDRDLRTTILLTDFQAVVGGELTVYALDINGKPQVNMADGRYLLEEPNSPAITDPLATPAGGGKWVIVKLYAPNPVNGRIAAITRAIPLNQNPMPYQLLQDAEITPGPRAMRAVYVSAGLPAGRSRALNNLLIRPGANIKDIILDRPATP